MSNQFNKKIGANPLIAAQSVWQGMLLIKHKQLRKYIIIPILINFLLYSVMLYVGYEYVDGLMLQFIPDWLQWLSWLIYPLFFISFFLAGFFTFTLLANLIASPFYGELSAKTQQLLNESTEEMVTHSFISIIGSELKRIVYLLSRSIPIVILSIIPGINIIAPLLWGVFGAWGISMEYLAYPLENEGVLFQQQRAMQKTIRVGALSFGGIVLLGLAVPVINMIMPPIAVISATIYRNKLRHKQS